MPSNASSLSGVSVVCIGSERSMSECSHEAQGLCFTSFMLCRLNKQKKVIIRTADTDAVMIIWWHLVWGSTSGS